MGFTVGKLHGMAWHGVGLFLDPSLRPCSGDVMHQSIFRTPSDGTAVPGHPNTQLIDLSTGLYGCRQCGRRWWVNQPPRGTRRGRGWWRCLEGCNDLDSR